MQINRTLLLKNGKRQLTITLDEGESIMPLRNDGFYKLGSQLDEIMAAHYILEAVPVGWCSIEQKWVE